MMLAHDVFSAGGATPPAAFFEALSSLKQLRVLEVLPGVYGQIAGYDMDVGQGDAGESDLAGACVLCWALGGMCTSCGCGWSVGQIAGYDIDVGQGDAGGPEGLVAA